MTAPGVVLGQREKHQPDTGLGEGCKPPRCAVTPLTRIRPHRSGRLPLPGRRAEADARLCRRATPGTRPYPAIP